MLRVIAFVLSLAAVLPQRVTAHLWETLPQINAQYGRPLYKYAGQQRGEEIWKYKWKNYFVYVTCIAGKSEDETFIHRVANVPFQREEIQSLLQLESLGMRWQKSATVPMWALSARAGRAVAIAGFTSSLPDLNYPCFGVNTIAYARRHKIPGI
jgi:hypothetical protein